MLPLNVIIFIVEMEISYIIGPLALQSLLSFTSVSVSNDFGAPPSLMVRWSFW